MQHAAGLQQNSIPWLLLQTPAHLDHASFQEQSRKPDSGQEASVIKSGPNAPSLKYSRDAPASCTPKADRLRQEVPGKSSQAYGAPIGGMLSGRHSQQRKQHDQSEEDSLPSAHQAVSSMLASGEDGHHQGDISTAVEGRDAPHGAVNSKNPEIAAEGLPRRSILPGGSAHAVNMPQSQGTAELASSRSEGSLQSVSHLPGSTAKKPSKCQTPNWGTSSEPLDAQQVCLSCVNLPVPLIGRMFLFPAAYSHC
jgi:hypothetical protein